MKIDEMIREFEAILVADYKVDLAKAREGENWWRFVIDGRSFQGGVHTTEFRLSLTMGQLNTDPAVIDNIWDDIKKANQKLGAQLAVLAEEDCYLHIQSRVVFAKMSAGKMKEMIQACLTIANTNEAASIYNKWPNESW